MTYIWGYMGFLPIPKSGLSPQEARYLYFGEPEHQPFVAIQTNAWHMAAKKIQLLSNKLVLYPLMSESCELRNCWRNLTANSSTCRWVPLGLTPQSWFLAHGLSLKWSTWCFLFMYDTCMFVWTALSLMFILPQSEVTLCGNAPWLRGLARRLSSARRKQLMKIRRFLKLKTTKQYVCQRTGAKRCVRTSSLNFLNMQYGTRLFESVSVYIYNCYLGWRAWSEGYANIPRPTGSSSLGLDI